MRTVSRAWTLGILATACITACGQTEPVDDGSPEPEDREDVSAAAEDDGSSRQEYELSTSKTSVQAAVERRLQARARVRQDPAAQPARERLRGRRGPSHDFEARSVVRDEEGQRHVRLEHRYRGVRVLSSTAIVHLSASGDVQSEDLHGVKEGIDIDTTPHLTEEEAIAAIETQPQRTGKSLILPIVELVILPETQRVVRATGERVRGDETDLNAVDVERRVVGAKLVYQVDTLDEGAGEPFSSYRYLVDARTGEVLRTRSLGHAALGTGKSFMNNGPANNFDVPIDTRPFISSGAAFFEPFDSFRNFGVWDEDFCRTCGPNKNSSNTWGDGQVFAADAVATTNNRRTAIADGLYGMQVTWDMFSNVFGRQGYDDAFYQGNAFVHSDTNWGNAMYYYLSGNIAVGDGAGATRSLYTSLDTLGHEFGHGIIDFTSELGDNAEAEGLNEAAADIIGELAEAYELGNGAFNQLSSIPASPGPNFVGTSSGRDFITPGEWDHWTAALEDLPGEHTRALPMDHAFFFLSRGSINNPLSSQFSNTLPWGMKGIGLDKAARIWIRALTVHMDSDTDYAGARIACLAAATDLFGASSPERDAVKNAFAGIHVGSPAIGYPGSPSTMPESEPNTYTNPDLVVMPSLPAGAPVNGPLSARRVVLGTTSASDTDDHFVFDVPAGKKLRVTLLNQNDNKLTLFDENDNVVDEEGNKPGNKPEQRGVSAANTIRTFTARVSFVSGAPFPLVPIYSLFIDFI